MRDYFSNLILEGVTGGTRGYTASETSNTATCSPSTPVTSSAFLGVTPCYKSFVYPHVTPENSSGVTLNPSKLAVLPLVTPVTYENDRYKIEERAAIYQYDAGYSKEDAEALAIMTITY